MCGFAPDWERVEIEAFGRLPVCSWYAWTMGVPGWSTRRDHVVFSARPSVPMDITGTRHFARHREGGHREFGYAVQSFWARNAEIRQPCSEQCRNKVAVVNTAASGTGRVSQTGRRNPLPEDSMDHSCSDRTVIPPGRHCRTCWRQLISSISTPRKLQLLASVPDHIYSYAADDAKNASIKPDNAT